MGFNPFTAAEKERGGWTPVAPLPPLRQKAVRAAVAPVIAAPLPLPEVEEPVKAKPSEPARSAPQRVEAAPRQEEPAGGEAEERLSNEELQRLAEDFSARERHRAKEHATALAELKRQQQQHQQASALLKKAAEELERAHVRALDELRHGAADLILEAARRIAGEALRVQPALLDALVDEAVDALGTQGLLLKVAPEDVERVESVLKGHGRLTVEADPNIEGGCVASSPAGRIDATLGTAFAAIETIVHCWRDAG